MLSKRVHIQLVKGYLICSHVMYHSALPLLLPPSWLLLLLPCQVSLFKKEPLSKQESQEVSVGTYFAKLPIFFLHVYSGIIILL